MKKEELLELIGDRGGRITTSAAMAEGYPSSLLKLLASEGAVVLESRGVYALADVPLDDFAVIALRWPKAIFSHGSALWLLGLSDRVPQAVEVTCPQGYNAPALLEEYPGTKIRRQAPERYELGTTVVLTPTGTKARAYDAERCICDLLLARRRSKVDLQLFSDVLRGYSRNDKKDMPKLARYADTLGVAGELRDLVEVVQW